MSQTFYALLVATIAAAAIPLATILWKGEQLGSFLIVILSMWLYFYGFMAVNTARELAFVVPGWVYDFGQLVALAALLALLAGWFLGMRARRRARPRRDGPAFSPLRLWVVGMSLIVLGTASHYLFFSQTVVDYKSTSAYWYMLYHIGYPGAALCVIASNLDARLRRTPLRIAFFLAVAVALFPHVANARRGPLFPMVIALAFVPAVLNRRGSRLAIMTALAGAGTVMLLFLSVRPYIGRQASPFQQGRADAWLEAMGQVTMDDVFVKRTRQVGDNEYVYHCAMVATLEERGCYQYGTSYVSVLLGWIPRVLWAEKPGLGEGWFRPHVMEEISTITGWEMTTGAASGGVAEVFNEFGYWSFALWAALGYLVARWYRRTMEAPDPRAVAGYVGLLCASHWLVSQGIAAAFVPFAIYEIVPALAFRIARAPSPVRGTSQAVSSPALVAGRAWPSA